MAAHCGPGEIVHVRGDAMRRQNHEAFAARVDERHHRIFVWRVWIGETRFCATLVAIVERGFVTVMAVGNDELLVRHRGLNRESFLRIGNDPETMRDAVLIVNFGGGRRSGFGFGENCVRALLRIGIEHE